MQNARIVIAIREVMKGNYKAGPMQGALYGAATKHYVQERKITANMSKSVFDKLNKTIKESAMDPEADALAIFTPDRIMAPHQFEVMANTLYDKYKPVEGGAGPVEIGEGGAGGAGLSREVEGLQALYDLARANTGVALNHLNDVRRALASAEEAYAKTQAAEAEIKDKLAQAKAGANKRKRDQA